jgi:hypothetical protein
MVCQSCDRVRSYVFSDCVVRVSAEITGVAFELEQHMYFTTRLSSACKPTSIPRSSMAIKSGNWQTPLTQDAFDA